MQIYVHVYICAILEIMSKTISFFNHKGGVAKSTSTMATASILATMGYKVLIIDNDPQGSTSVGLGYGANTVEKTLYDVFASKSERAEDLIVSVRQNVDLIPTNLSYGKAEIFLMGAKLREYKLKRAIKPFREDYDFILIDCSPYLGQLGINALAMSNGVVIPVETDYLSMASLPLTFETIEDVQYDLNSKLKVLGILFTKFDKRTVQAKEVIDTVTDTYKESNPIFSSVIRYTVKVKESPSASESVDTYAPDHPVTEDYKKFVNELLKSLE